MPHQNSVIIQILDFHSPRLIHGSDVWTLVRFETMVCVPPQNYINDTAFFQPTSTIIHAPSFDLAVRWSATQQMISFRSRVKKEEWTNTLLEDRKNRIFSDIWRWGETASHLSRVVDPIYWRIVLSVSTKYLLYYFYSLSNCRYHTGSCNDWWRPCRINWMVARYDYQEEIRLSY